uniref:Uncharacterized protein n=1 Tax=Aegilops tauschii subsp. strangulata TaxID=200361 RepID=A0A452Z8J1_AEGTS
PTDGLLAPPAVDDVMWPLCFISDRLFKVPEDGGGDGPGAPLPPDGRIPLARRSYFIDVSPPLFIALSYHHCLATLV